MVIVKKQDSVPIPFSYVTASIVLLCSIAASAISPHGDPGKDQIITELRPNRSFPSSALEAKGIFLNNAVSVSLDDNHDLYVSNSKEGNVLKFSAAGDFLLKIGRLGQAPGEFEFPVKVFPRSGNLFVLDSVRSGIQVYSGAGTPQRQVKLFRSCSDFCVNSMGDIFVARGPKDISDFLVDVLDPTGKLEFSFGNPVRSSQNPPGIANKIRIEVDESDHIILLFQTTGRLHTYNKNGEFLKEIPIITDFIAKDLQYNQKQFKSIQRGKRVGYHHIIEAIRPIDGEYYLLRNGEGRVEIMRSNREGRILETYFFPASEDYYAIDFDVLKRAGSPVFYVLEAAPECRVTAFSINKGVHENMDKSR